MRIRAVTGPVVLAALFATTPQLAVGQERIHFDARPGTEIQSDQLGEFLAKNLSLVFGTDMRPLSVTLSLEMISREDGVVGRYESEPVKVEPGMTYDGSTFVTYPSVKSLAPGFGDRRKITFGRLVVINHEEQYLPRECEGATHAVRITVVSDGERLPEIKWPTFLCLNVEG